MMKLVFVPGCAACDRPVGVEEAMCRGCSESLVELGAACLRCARPFDGERSFVCGACVAAPPAFERIVAGWRYGGELGVALRRLKFGGRTEVARQLGPLVRGAVARVEAEVAIPVPLHWWRMAGRRFNQAALLLRYAAPRMPIDATALVRRRATVPQTGLTAARRARNVEGAFVVPARRAARVAGRRVLLFDDVVTTGATMAAAARALRAAGAREVIGVCVARAE